MRVKSFLCAFFCILLATHVCYAASPSLQEIQNGYFRNYPPSEGFPNIKKAFESFFEQSKWSGEAFHAIHLVDGRRAKIRIKFSVDSSDNRFVRVHDIYINDSFAYSALNERNPLFDKSVGSWANLPPNRIIINDFLADIFLSYEGPPPTAQPGDNSGEFDDYEEYGNSTDRIQEVDAMIFSAFHGNTLYKKKWQEAKPVEFESVHGGRIAVKTYYAPGQTIQIAESVEGSSRRSFMLQYKSNDFRKIIPGLEKGMTTDDIEAFFGEPPAYTESGVSTYTYGVGTTINLTFKNQRLEEIWVDNFPTEEFPEQVYNDFIYKK